MNPDQRTDDPAASLTSFLDAEHAKSDETELKLKDSLNSFLEQEENPRGVVVANGDRGVVPAGGSQSVQTHDFRNPMLLSPSEQRKLRVHQEEFTQGAAARLSIHLRSEVALKLTSLSTVAFQKLAQSWSYPCHLNLFKMDPLRGVSILEISAHLGLCMVDRQMGGPGLAATTEQEISEIEKVLLEQTAQLFLEEWCAHWANFKDFKPAILGYENNGRYIQTIQPETMMLVVSMEAGFGDCVGQIQLAVPYLSMESLIHRVCQGKEPAPVVAPPAPPPATPWKWNKCFNDVRVPVTAEWEGLELTAGQILALKIGDVLPLEARHMEQINVRVADTLKFHGRPGTVEGRWAVELTQVINTKQ